MGTSVAHDLRGSCRRLGPRSDDLLILISSSFEDAQDQDQDQKIAAFGSSYRDREESIECCSLLFIVNRPSVQLFIGGCSFLFSIEPRLLASLAFFPVVQRLAFPGMKLALQPGSLDSNNKKAEPCR
jgi:hypothetical protein